MRGKGSNYMQESDVTGITPAYAGKSFTLLIQFRGQRDHPRLCGEKFTHLRAFFHFVGSPPPMRGKVFLPRGAGLVIRITPAYAGKSEKGLSKGQRN